MDMARCSVWSYLVVSRAGNDLWIFATFGGNLRQAQWHRQWAQNDGPMPATAEVFKPGFSTWISFRRSWANFRPRLKAKVQGRWCHTLQENTVLLSAARSNTSNRRLYFIFSPFQQTRQYSLTGSLVQHCYCQFDFRSFSPVPAEALRMYKANELLTCPAAPALPSHPEHADRLQQLRERGQVFSGFSPEPGDCGRVRVCARAWACNQRWHCIAAQVKEGREKSRRAPCRENSTGRILLPNSGGNPGRRGLCSHGTSSQKKAQVDA